MNIVSMIIFQIVLLFQYYNFGFEMTILSGIALILGKMDVLREDEDKEAK